jgi:hypothetical protein
MLPEDTDFMVYIDHSNLTIQIYQAGAWLYEVDLERCTNSAEMLDWIMQLNRKQWCTGDVLHEVIGLFNAACLTYFNKTVQGAICPQGVDHKVTWPRTSMRLVKT